MPFNSMGFGVLGLLAQKWARREEDILASGDPVNDQSGSFLSLLGLYRKPGVDSQAIHLTVFHIMQISQK